MCVMAAVLCVRSVTAVISMRVVARVHFVLSMRRSRMVIVRTVIVMRVGMLHLLPFVRLRQLRRAASAWLRARPLQL